MDAMLQKIADFYEDEVDCRKSKDLLTALEPVMIVFLGVSSCRRPWLSPCTYRCSPLIGQLSSMH